MVVFDVVVVLGAAVVEASSAAFVVVVVGFGLGLADGVGVVGGLGTLVTVAVGFGLGLYPLGYFVTVAFAVVEVEAIVEVALLAVDEEEPIDDVVVEFWT